MGVMKACSSFGQSEHQAIVEPRTSTCLTVSGTSMNLEAPYDRYFRNKWNQFDFTIVVITVVEPIALLVLGDNVRAFSFVRIFRCLRAIRVLRIARISEHVQKMTYTLYFAAPSVRNGK